MKRVKLELATELTIKGIVGFMKKRYLLNNLWIKISNYKSQMSNNTQCQNHNVQNTVAKGLFWI